MDLKAFQQVSVIRRLLGGRTFPSDEERFKSFLLLAMLLACLPMPMVNFFLLLATTGEPTVLPPLAATSLTGIIWGLRRGLGLKAATVLFSVIMDAVFIHGVLGLQSPSMIIGLVFVPFIAALIAGPRTSTALLIGPLVFIAVMPHLLPRLAGLHLSLAALFIAFPSPESINFLALLGLVYVMGCVIEGVIHNLFIANEEEKDAKRKEIAAREDKERLLETVFRAVPVPLYVKDAELRYTFCSDTFYEFFAVSPAEVLGRKIEDVFEEELQKGFGEADRRMQDTGLAQRFSAKLMRSGREILSITVVKVPLTDQRGRFAGTVGAILDETDRYDQERKLQALLDANRSSLALLGHDLKNPIGSFRNLVRSMGDDECVTPEEFHEVLAEMGSSLDALYRLLEELLEWAKADASVGAFSPAYLRLAPKARAILDFFRIDGEKKGLTLESKVPDDLSVHADATMLDAILRNLVGNAVKFTPRGGKVAITAERAETERGTRVTVSDNGIGMSATMVVALLKRGLIRHRRGTDNEPGTGLGLSLCGRLIDRHGGILSIESVEGSGSAFSVLFPDGDRPPAARTAPA